MIKLASLMLCLGLSSWAPAMAQTLVENPRLPQPYHEWNLLRHDQSTIVCYANFSRLDPARPLAVWLQGSGYYSLFPVRKGETRHGPLALVAEALGPEVQILAVEKRGVPFGLIGTGGATGAPPEYQEHATLEGRSDDIIEILGAFQIQGLLPERLILVGHSEGADVAAKVAAEYQPVSHLICLAGGGANQMFELMTLVRKSDASPQEKEAEIDALWSEWAKIQADPTSTEKMFSGHAYRRWSSYLAKAPLENLLKTDAKILMIHGSEDAAVPVESADLCAVELRRAGRQFEYLRLPAADHSLRTKAQVEENKPPFLFLGYILRRFLNEQTVTSD